MSRITRSCVAIFVLAAIAFSLPCPGETNLPVIHVGVLAHRGAEKCISDWSPTIAYLQEKIPDYRFALVPCNFAEIQDRMKAKDLEFVVGNPFLYADMESKYRLHRIATLVMGRGELASCEFHGAVFCLSSNKSIRRLGDLKGKTVAAVDETSFGGYAVQARELKQEGLEIEHDLKSLRFMGNHDEVLNAVVRGGCDAGFIRADVLEELIIEGKVSRELIRVLPPPAAVEVDHQHSYPASTRSYPEWPMAVAHDISRDLAKQVSIALFLMPADSDAMIAAGASGWVTPANYQEVHNCLRELGLPPYEGYGKITLLSAVRKLWPAIAALVILFLLWELLRRFRRQKRLVKIVAERTAELSEVNRSLQKEMADRRQAEEKNLKMAAIVEFSDDAIYSKNLDGVITSWNKGAVRLYGYTEAEAVGSSISTLIPDTHSSEILDLMTRIKNGKRVEHFETVRRKKDGSLVDVSLTISPIFGLDGVITGASMIARDITSRKKAEAAIRANDARLESLLRISQYHAPGVQELLDFALNEAIALTGSKIGYIYHYDEDSREFVLNTWSKEVMKECSINAPDTLYHLDKTGVWGDAVRLRKAVVINDFKAPDPRKKGYPEGHAELRRFLTIPVMNEGRIVAVVGVANKDTDYDQTDIGQLTLLMDSVWKITDRKRAERALQEKTEVLDNFFDIALDLLCIADTDGNFRMLNREWEKTLGYTREELMSKKFLEFVHPDDLPGTLETIGKLVAQQQVTDFVNRYRCKDGSYRWIEWRSAPAGNLVYAAARDITERRRTETELRESKDEAEAANKAKSVFLANMSHEIRTPLNAIIGFGELLAGLTLDEKQRTYVDPIRTAGRSLLRLLNDLLDLSKIEAGRMDLQISSVDLRLLLEEIEVIFAPRIIQKGIKFALEIDPELPRELMLDEIRVRQVLVNIVGNALKFTEEGTVLVTVSPRFKNADRCLLDLDIAVKDTGVGIPASELEHIFGAFRQQSEQSTAKYGGTGLGLTISRRLAEMMNGLITVKSELGKGSTFSLWLPDVAVATSNIAVRDIIRDERLDISAFKFRGQRILIVDDVESNRVMLRALLEQVGLSVVEAQDGQAAITLADEARPELIIMDIRMPGMSGFQATAAIKRQPSTRSIPVIALTASTQEIDSPAVVQAGFASYLVKPLATTVLLREIDRVLGGLARLDASAAAVHAANGHSIYDGAMPDIPDTVRAVLLKDAEGMMKGIVVSRARGLADQLAAVGTEHKAPQLVSLAQQLSKGADKLDVTIMKQVLQQICRLLSKKISGEDEKSGPAADERG